MTAPAATPRWIVRYRPSPAARSRLICIPYAGGTAKAFQPLAAALAPQVEVCAVEYPGRSTRFGEPLLRQVGTIVEQLGPALLPWLDRPFALFGYSMGGQVAFELARWLR